MSLSKLFTDSRKAVPCGRVMSGHWNQADKLSITHSGDGRRENTCDLSDGIFLSKMFNLKLIMKKPLPGKIGATL